MIINFTVTPSGSVVLFTPNDAESLEWALENVNLEGWQWLGDSFAVEHRYAGNAEIEGRTA